VLKTKRILKPKSPVSWSRFLHLVCQGGFFLSPSLVTPLIGGPTLRLLRIWGDEWGQTTVLLLLVTRKRRVNGNLAISWWLEAGTSLHSQRKSTNWSRKPNDIPWMLLASLRLSVTFLTLWRCKVDKNSSTPELNPECLRRLKVGMLVGLQQKMVFMNRFHW